MIKNNTLLKEKAFSLVEILVVVVIIGIIAIIFTQMVNLSKLKTKYVYKNALKEVGLAVKNVLSDHPSKDNPFIINDGVAQTDIGFPKWFCENINTIGNTNCNELAATSTIKTINGFVFTNLVSNRYLGSNNKYYYFASPRGYNSAGNTVLYRPGIEDIRFMNLSIITDGKTNNRVMGENEFEITVTKDGEVFPAGVASERADIIPYRVIKVTGSANSEPTVIARGLSYNEARCVAGKMPAFTKDGYIRSCLLTNTAIDSIKPTAFHCNNCGDTVNCNSGCTSESLISGGTNVPVAARLNLGGSTINLSLTPAERRGAQANAVCANFPTGIIDNCKECWTQKTGEGDNPVDCYVEPQ